MAGEAIVKDYEVTNESWILQGMEDRGEQEEEASEGRVYYGIH